MNSPTKGYLLLTVDKMKHHDFVEQTLLICGDIFFNRITGINVKCTIGGLNKKILIVNINFSLLYYYINLAALLLNYLLVKDQTFYVISM